VPTSVASVAELIDRSLFESRHGRWAQALEHADQALAQEPGHALAHKRRGLALWHLGQRDEGVLALVRSTQLAPDFASAHYNLACCYAQLERREDMLRALRRAIALSTDYVDKARRDADFEEFEDDEEFLALTRPDGEAAQDLQRVFEGDDLAAIADRLGRLGDAIPLAAVDWEDEGEGGDLSGVLERHARDLDVEVLAKVYRVVATRVFADLYDFDGWTELHRALRDRDPEGFAALLVKCWRERYQQLDAGHLGTIEEVMLEELEALPGGTKAQLVLEGLRSHGPDALADHRALCASALADLGDAPLTSQLVDAVDRVLHGSTYLDDDPATRRRRVVRALPPPPLRIPEDTEDRWAWQRLSLQSDHPVQVLQGARQLSIQRDAEARALLLQHLDSIVELALDESLADDPRITAVSVLQRVGSVETLRRLVPALDARSPKLLDKLGEVLHQHGVPFDAEAAASVLSARLHEASDWSEEHDVIHALRWFVTPTATRLLLDATAHRREAVRREALHGLGYHAPDEAIDTLATQLVEGSGQCVAAAATALSRYGTERAQAILRDEERYQRVLARAKAEARWVTAALPCFQVPSVSADLFALFCTTSEHEAFDVLAAGISAHPREELLLELVRFGLDTYRLQGRPGRYLVEIARAAVAAHPEGPGDAVREGLVALLTQADAQAIADLCGKADRDCRYATERAPDPIVAERQRRAYAWRLQDALAPQGEAAAALPWSLLGLSRESVS